MTTKEFPQNYPPEVVKFIENATFSKGFDVMIVGSGSLREMRYSADVDCYERTKIQGKTRASALRNASKRFKQIVKNILSLPLTYITDIKAGSIEDWVVINRDAHIHGKKILGYSANESRAKVNELYEQGVIDENEYKDALALLVEKPTPEQFLLAKEKLRFNIVRWNIDEIKKGQKTHRGRKVTLAEALGQPVIAKLDAIILVDNNRFIEASVIYELIHKNSHDQLNAFGTPNIPYMLREAIFSYYTNSKPFKASKRQFSLLRFLKKMKKATPLISYFNSDLGLLYGIISDLDTLVLLVEHSKHLPKKRVEFELKHIPARLGGISHLKDLLKEEDDVFKALKRIEANPRDTEAVDNLSKELQSVLNKHAYKELEKMKYYPPTKFYLP
jgi:hypothetical protein